MKEHTVEFLKGVIGSEGLPKPSRPTIAFFGRSNVGKSSTLNRLVGHIIARANKKPGRTTEINYYLVDGQFYLADLPGYGYAKLPPRLREKISGYLSWFAADQSIDIRLAVLIVDGEVGVKDNDLEMFRLLSEYGRPLVIFANKCDKASARELSANLKALETTFAPFPVIPGSAKTGRGLPELWKAIEATIVR